MKRALIPQEANNKTCFLGFQKSDQALGDIHMIYCWIRSLHQMFLSHQMHSQDFLQVTRLKIQHNKSHETSNSHLAEGDIIPSSAAHHIAKLRGEKIDHFIDQVCIICMYHIMIINMCGNRHPHRSWKRLGAIPREPWARCEGRDGRRCQPQAGRH